MSVHLIDSKLFRLVPKPVPFVQEVVSAVCDTVVGGKRICGLIVFKDTSTQARMVVLMPEVS